MFNCQQRIGDDRSLDGAGGTYICVNEAGIRHKTCGQRKMSQVLQVLEIFEIWICHIFEFCWLPKMTSTLSKRPTEHDGVVIEGRRYSSSGRER